MSRPSGSSFTSRQQWLALPFRLRRQPAEAGDRVQIFLHIPKCGGTTLDYVLMACTANAGQGHRRFGFEPYDPPIWMRQGWLGAWSTAETAGPSAWQQLQSVSGHLPYGIHSLTERPCRYVTLVRDPVAREVSSYNFHYQRGYIDGSKSLADYIVEGALLDNPQVRMLAGKDAMSGPCGEASLGEALDNLERHFDLVGLAERSDAFLSALLAINGWPPVLYPHAQVTGVKLIERPDAALHALLRDYHALDVRLHEIVTQRWQAWIDEQVVGLASPDAADPVIMIPPDFAQSQNFGQVAAGRVTTAGPSRVLHIARQESA